MGQVQKVTEQKVLGAWQPAELEKQGRQPQGDLSSPSIFLVMRFRPLTFHVAGPVVQTFR